MFNALVFLFNCSYRVRAGKKNNQWETSLLLTFILYWNTCSKNRLTSILLATEAIDWLIAEVSCCFVSHYDSNKMPIKCSGLGLPNLWSCREMQWNAYTCWPNKNGMGWGMKDAKRTACQYTVILFIARNITAKKSNHDVNL